MEIKKASQNREQENAEFQQTVADQRATQDILSKALLRLQDFINPSVGQGKNGREEVNKVLIFVPSQMIPSPGMVR